LIVCVLGSGNYQFYLNHNLIEEKKLDYDDILKHTISFLQKINGVDRALEYADLQEAMLPKALKEQFINGYYPSRCGDVLVILKPGFIDDEYDKKGTTHGIWNPYDAHIPLLFFGNGIAKGKEYNENLYERHCSYFSEFTAYTNAKWLYWKCENVVFLKL
jgi:hypothetical protein